MCAFRNSMAAGVDVLDLNVTLTADDVLVVQHDLTVDRTTNGTGTVAEMSFADLADLDNAYWFTPDCGTCTGPARRRLRPPRRRTGDVPRPPGSPPDDFAVPTLSDVVGAFPDTPLNVEIKGTGPLALETAEVLVAELAALDRLRGRRRLVRRRGHHPRDDDRARCRGLARPRHHGGLRRRRASLPEGQRILQLPPVFDGTDLLTAEIIGAATTPGT